MSVHSVILQSPVHTEEGSSPASALSFFFMDRKDIRRVLLHFPSAECWSGWWWLLLLMSADVWPRYSMLVRRHWAAGVCSASLWSAGGDSEASEVTEVNFSSPAGRPHMSSFWRKSKKGVTMFYNHGYFHPNHKTYFRVTWNLLENDQKCVEKWNIFI